MESVLTDLTNFAMSNAEIAPLLIFGALLLAGLNLPVSEDLMLLTSALIAVERPELLWQLFAGVYAGAFFSDIICYWLGRSLGPKLWKIKWFAKMVKQETVEKVGGFYERYGILTLLLGRFIPFGVRNGLFLTAGLSKMNFLKFALSDLLAATITCSLYFWLYYTYGNAMVEIIKHSNVVIFSVALIAVVVMVIRRRKNAKDVSDDLLD